jgi:hypothetical protein
MPTKKTEKEVKKPRKQETRRPREQATMQMQAMISTLKDGYLLQVNAPDNSNFESSTLISSRDGLVLDFYSFSR